jgi:plasmid stabilization system protein ParE
VEVERVVTLVAQRPDAGAPMPGGRRRWLLTRFPFAVVYRVTDDSIRVLAVAHHRRRPGYWQARA